MPRAQIWRRRCDVNRRPSEWWKGEDHYWNQTKGSGKHSKITGKKQMKAKSWFFIHLKKKKKKQQQISSLIAHDLPCFLFNALVLLPLLQITGETNTTRSKIIKNISSYVIERFSWLTTRNWKNSKNMRRAQFDNVRKLRLDQPALIFLIHMYACVCPPSLSLSSRRCFLGWATHVQSCCWRRSVHAKVGGDLSENCRVCVARSPTFPQSLFTWSGIFLRLDATI